jgi:hypothetical protein
LGDGEAKSLIHRGFLQIDVDLGETYLKGDRDVGRKRFTDVDFGEKKFRGGGEVRSIIFFDVFSGEEIWSIFFFFGFPSIFV